MSQLITRRTALAAAGLTGASIALAACSSDDDDTSPNGGGGGSLTWWDHFQPLENVHRTIFEQFGADGGPAVEHTVYNPDQQGEALQIAFGSEQLPDVFTLAGVDMPTAALVNQGWFTPLIDQDSFVASMDEGSLQPGLHYFDGDLYTFPIFSARQYETLNWYNRSLLEEAGLDPDDPPTSWDDLRAAARAVQGAGAAGILLPVGFADRMAAFVMELAQTAGFPGFDGVDLSTGEYAYHHDAIVEAIEFVKSFDDDGTLFPGSGSLDAREGRTRWASGAAGFFLDGPWNAGVVAGEFEELLEDLGVGPIPTPEGSPATITKGPTGGTFWISGSSPNAEAASELLQLLSSAEYQQGLAEAMDQPPQNLDAVADSNAHETYKRAIDLFDEQVFIGPAPQISNPLVGEVQAAMRPVDPDLGAIVQGYFTGQVSDLRGTLHTLSEQMEQNRDSAIESAGGGEVTAEDWAFTDWQVGVDYQVEV